MSDVPLAADMDPDCRKLGCTHPHTGIDEWVLMWMRGLEPAEISRACGVDRWRVGRAIDARVRRDPALPVLRLKRHLHPMAGTQTERLAFGQKVAEYRDWLERHDHAPRERSTDRYERELAGWLSRQRGADRRRELDPVHAQALDEVSRWRRPALGQLDEGHFAERVEQLRVFVEAEQRMPTRYGGAGEAERRLAVWLMGLRSSSRAAWLTSDRIASLDAAAPGWPRRRNLSPREPPARQ